jgi:hypothetical protein
VLNLPCFSKKHVDSSSIESISLLGTVHRRRWKWNPFDNGLDMVQLSKTRWQISLPVNGPQPPEINGIYTVRLVINHSPKRYLKTSISNKTNNVWDLIETSDGKSSHNINFTVDVSQSILFEFDSSTMQLTLTPSAGLDSLHHINGFDSYQLNGFPWDNLDMFEKFDCRLKNREFKKLSDELWTIDVPLSKNGGIDFRADGVYQFLISSNHDEDLGFSALNDGSNTLVQGTGFGSSHGTSLHSGCTVKILEDGLYRFNLHEPESSQPHFSVEKLPSDSRKTEPIYLNNRNSFQLLGSIFKDNQFDPTDPGRKMLPIEGSSKVSLKTKVRSGFHVVNIATDNELFLDTMGLGCWLNIDDNSGSQSIECITWHGKPHELNICFELDIDSNLEFIFDPNTDRLIIKNLDVNGQLTPVASINEMSLVGSFEENNEMEAWNPTSALNQMNPLNPGSFERVIHLTAGKTYNYKYVANRSPWAIVYADYELDCHGFDFTGSIPDAADPSKRSLKRFGQLTSHGNPPALEFTATHTGQYRFYIDIVFGGYSVHLFS